MIILGSVSELRWLAEISLVLAFQPGEYLVHLLRDFLIPLSCRFVRSHLLIQLRPAVPSAISRSSPAIIRIGTFLDSECVTGIVNSRICLVPGQTRGAFSIRRMLGSRDPSGNLRRNRRNSAEGGAFPDRFRRRPPRKWTDSYTGYRCEIRGTFLRREPKRVNLLTPL